MAARQQKGITAGYVGRPRELNLVAPTWAALPPSSAVCDQPFRSNPQTNPRHKSRMRVHLPCKVEDDLAARRRGRERSERPQAPSCQSAQLLTRRWGDASSSGLCLGLGSVGEPNGWLQTAEDGGKAAQTGESRCGSCVGKRIRRAMLFCCLAAISAGPADALALCVARWQRTAGSARHAPGGVAERSEALDLKRARFGSVLPVLPSPLGVQPHAQSAAIRRLRCAIGWARLARSDVDQLFCMGLACRRAGVYVRCVLAVVRRPLRCLMDRRNGRYAGRGVVSTRWRLHRGRLLRLVAGLGD